MEGVDRRAAESFFSKKVPGSERMEGSRHVAYRVFAPNNRLLIGNLTVSRGSSGSELDLRNLKGLATDMGMSLEGFIEASNCRIRPEIVVLCIVSRILEDAAAMHYYDPIKFDTTLVESLGRAIDEWFIMVPRSVKGKLSTKERKELARCTKRLTNLAENHGFESLMERYLGRAAAVGKN